MKNWKTLTADVVKLMNKNFTTGRGGKKIEYVVLHHNAGVLTVDQIWQVWQSRPASAHYQVQSDGVIGQLVWDDDTAHHAANWDINQRSIGVEISNLAGGPGWPISAKALEEGAHLVAAICLNKKLGRPQPGKNIRYHREFTGTSCPHHLAPGGKYHDSFIARAQHWYAVMNGDIIEHETPAHITEGNDMSENTDQLILDQLTGPKGVNGPGWPQLGGRYLADAVAAIGAHLGLPGFYDPAAGDPK